MQQKQILEKNTKEKEVIILMGKSGSGKGTQADNIKSYYKENKNIDLLHFTTGEGFRELSKSSGYLPEHIKTEMQKGTLMPEFLAVWNWSNIFINKLNEETNFILDGAPRKMHEAHLLENAFKFLNYKNITVIYINVSDQWAKSKLLDRKRIDDNEMSIDARLKWFETDVIPVIEYYKHNNIYNFIEINGEDSIENVGLRLSEILK